MSTWFKYLVIVPGSLMVLGIAGILVTQRVSDGPILFLQGGSFETGALVDEPVTDWSFAVGKRTEFELVGFGTSRVAGFVMHDGVAYMTCDLGFMWNRFSGPRRWLLEAIYVFKRWHEDAVQDGRALVRVDGKLYKASFVKVDDPALDAALRDQLEELAREYVAPEELGPRPTEPPDDIWFFRMDPRT